jgi:FkbM family methyltransferase
MPIPNRKINAVDAITTLGSLGVEFGCVLDVGVQRETAALKQSLPHIRHHLFEPVPDYFKHIKTNYADLKYVLHPIAISEKDGIAYLNSVGRIESNQNEISHSWLSETAIPPGTPGYVSSKEIKVRSLDSVLPEIEDINPLYFLKIDIDGLDLAVLKGATETLKHTGVVMIEATIQNLIDRATYLSNHGFTLIDIVDPAYYKGVLWQADLIFASKRLLSENKRLSPMSDPTASIDPSQWFTAGYEISR